MNAEISESDLLGKAETVTEQIEAENPLHALQQAIAAMPDIDQEKVEAVIAKLRSGTLNILGSEADSLASAERIARQIIEESKSG